MSVKYALAFVLMLLVCVNSISDGIVINEESVDSNNVQTILDEMVKRKAQQLSQINSDMMMAMKGEVGILYSC